jgi:uncharacterized protein YjbI with pentapeptide repeats
MVDLARVAPEAETPVNPYSLLEAVNSSSETAHTGWLIFLAIMTYIMIAVAGVTHQDLLLGTPVELPILQVKIQLKQFFQFAPVVLVLFHLGVLAHLVLVSRKTLEFDHAIRLLEITERRTHPLRLELHNFFFVQAIAGPHRSAVMSGFLHAMSWLTLMILPVVLLLYIQVVFLPYHDLATTWVQRIAVLLDVLVLLLIGVFLIRAETSFFQAFARTTTAHPVGSTLTCIVLAAVCVLSLFAATIPGEPLDRITASVLGTNSAPGQRAAGGFSLPFLGASSDGSLFGIFLRNLVVTDADLVVDKDVTPDEPTLNLRGRDLRYAKLDRSDLHQADFTGADLSNASLVGTDLRNAWLQCGDLSAWLLSSDRKAGRCTTAVGASFSKASLNQADMSGIDLTEANVGEAVLEGARLPYANLTGANFASARLRKADLSGGLRAPGANFLLADLQGADMTGAELQAADLRNAALQAVVLNLAQLQAARLNSADLEAATLVKANLQGADLTGARLSATDLRGALIWQTSPPEPDPAGLTDVSDIVIRAPNEAETAQLKAAVDRIEAPAVRAQVEEGIAPLLNAQTNSAWQGSMGFGTWQSLSAPPPVPVETPGVADFPTRLTGYLSTLMCKARWSDGALATGIARRARTQQFRGNPVTIYEDLKSNTCAAREGVPPDILRQLGMVADSLRTN